MKALRLFALLTLLLVSRASAHDGLDILVPITIPEAWNVLTLCQQNLGKLVSQKQWKEIPIQIFLSGQAIQFLQQQPASEAVAAKLKTLAFSADELLQAGSALDGPRVEKAAAAYDAALKEVVGAYDEKVVRAPIYSCPMCKGIREVEATARCFKCGMKLEPRIIPATGTPGELSIVLKPVLAQPLVAGQPSEVRIRFSWKRDGGPVTHEDLLVVHTERIHLLIIDESLEDYHHEHPRATEVPGEFAFTFTPRRDGSYRVFADVTPAVSQAQEYPMCDLAGSAPGGKVSNRLDTLESATDGLKYELRWLTGGAPVKTRRPVTALVTVSDAEGKPFARLEPIMGTYAHIVGFYEDRQTVVHIHPTGAEPQRATDRGGPSFMFRFYAPRAGFVRLYSQVQVGEVSRFAPFGLNVAP